MPSDRLDRHAALKVRFAFPESALLRRLEELLPRADVVEYSAKLGADAVHAARMAVYFEGARAGEGMDPAWQVVEDAAGLKGVRVDLEAARELMRGIDSTRLDLCGCSGRCSRSTSSPARNAAGECSSSPSSPARRWPGAFRACGDGPAQRKCSPPRRQHHPLRSTTAPGAGRR